MYGLQCQLDMLERMYPVKELNQADPSVIELYGYEILSGRMAGEKIKLVTAFLGSFLN